MKYIYIPKDRINEFNEGNLYSSHSIAEQMIKINLSGFESHDKEDIREMSKEELKKNAKVGDYILVRYTDKLVPFQIVDMTENNDLVLCSQNILERHIFDKNTNKWKDSELRKYMNSKEFMDKFDPEFIADLKVGTVHTEDYTTQDKFWIPSHEEIGEGNSSFLKENKGTRPFRC